MEEIKLKPCPFCGGMSAMFTRVGDADGARGATRVWHFGIGCTEGCYRVTVKHWFDGKPVAREAYWNGADWLSCEKRVGITPRVTHWQPLSEPPKEGELK